MACTIGGLDADHCTALTSAIVDLLSYQETLKTYAEVIDGLPTAET